MSITLSRHLELEDIILERQIGIDGQGAIDYDSPITLQGRSMREAENIENARGISVMLIADVWFAGDTDPMPDQGDRLTLADGLIGIVEMRTDARSLQDNVLDHVTLRLRPES